ncbi:MAG: serine hydrolase [Saprospiraceae bacterium]|nr:serine hydrolase [Saprospiraceae bacterium]
MHRFLCLALSVLVLPLAAQKKTELPPEIIESVEQRIAYGINPSIAIGVIDEDGPRYYSFGQTTPGGDPVDEHSIYEIGSITKTFTAALLMHMVDQGLMHLDDPVSIHLPDKVSVPARDGKKITLAQLSDHTSGLPRMPDNFTPANPLNPYADYTVEQMYDFVSGHTLRRDPGAEYEYSNLAQGLLGHILELKSGKTYEQLMIDEIAAPLGMHETRITLTPHMRQHLALPHSNGIQVENWDIPTLAGAGAIRSSVHDMLIYLGAQLGLIDSPMYLAMKATQQVRHDKAGNTRVGLGWHLIEGSKGDIITHTGGTGGYLTFAGFVRETNTGVVVFTNSTAAAGDIGLRLLDPETELSPVKKPVTTMLRSLIDSEGPEAAVKAARKAWDEERDNYDFDERDINSLGYTYLESGKVEPALAIFKLNIELYPDAWNTYDSYGEALLANGQKELAIENYQKSIELNPGNTVGIAALEKMGVKVESRALEIPTGILEQYVGVYEMMPGFDIEVTHTDGQLSIQATGQPRVEIYPKSETEFYLTVVNAQIRFNPGPDGGTESLTLFQGGQELTGERKEQKP